MSRFRACWLTAGLLVCAALAAGCKKDDAGKGVDDKGVSAAGAKDLDLIPVESDLVLGINMAQAQQSALFREYVLPLMSRDERTTKLTETIKTKCGIDPVNAASSVTIGFRGLGEPQPHGVMVVHGVPKDKSLACIDKMKDELAAEKIDVVKDGDAILVKGSRPGEVSAFTFVGDDTLLAVVGDKATKDGVLEAAKGQSALKSSKEFVSMYNQVKTSDTIWLMIRGNAEPVEKLTSRLKIKARGIFGSIHVTDGLAVDLRMRVESEEQASSVAAMIQSQVGAFASMADKVDIGNDKEDVRVQVSLSAQKLKSLVGLVGGMFGGGRGGFSLP